jgi:hypothetical protein
MMKDRLGFSICRATFVGAVCLLTASPCYAQLTSTALFKRATYFQTTAGAPTTSSAYDFDARAFFENPGDFNAGTLTYPGPGSPAAMAIVEPPSTSTVLEFHPANFPAQAAMDAAFPFGAYTVQVTGSLPTQSVSTSYTEDAYPITIPALTAATFAGLQGADPTQPFTFAFDSFVTGRAATNSYIFLNIFFHGTATLAFSQSLLPSTTTSILIPANTLQLATSYDFNLTFSNRVGALGFNFDTNGTFQTATTECSTPVGSSVSGGPVSATASFTPGNGFIAITATDTLADPTNAGQLLSGVSFTVSEGETTGTLRANAAIVREVGRNGTFSDFGSSITGWALNQNFNGGLRLCDLCTNLGALGPSHLLIGPPAASGTYASADGSIVRNLADNPFDAGTATFLVNVPGVTVNSSIITAWFFFGTQDGVSVAGVCPGGILSDARRDP